MNLPVIDYFRHLNYFNVNTGYQKEEKKTKGIAILGCTGSIGTQALEVIEAYPDLFDLEVITANNNADLLIEQALKFQPNTVVIVNKDHLLKVKDALEDQDRKSVV